jgi:hypothetical protein
VEPGRTIEEAGPPSADVVATLRRAAEAGTKIASGCVGAFVLAEAGLLDGLRATTHWVAADVLARRRADPHLGRSRRGHGMCLQWNVPAYDPAGSGVGPSPRTPPGCPSCRWNGRRAGPVHRARAPARAARLETTPLRWLLRVRVRRAQYLVVGTTPQAHRTAFQGRKAVVPAARP